MFYKTYDKADFILNKASIKNRYRYFVKYRYMKKKESIKKGFVVFRKNAQRTKQKKIQINENGENNHISN